MTDRGIEGRRRTERQTHRQTETEKQTGRQRQSHDKQRERRKGRDRETDIQTDRQTETNKLTGRHTGRQKDSTLDVYLRSIKVRELLLPSALIMQAVSCFSLESASDNDSNICRKEEKKKEKNTALQNRSS